jgi:hypothetical protein
VDADGYDAKYVAPGPGRGQAKCDAADAHRTRSTVGAKKFFAPTVDTVHVVGTIGTDDGDTIDIGDSAFIGDGKSPSCDIGSMTW